ncbi:hypothetical protein TNCV_753101 [Trichonephila clavipes]|uniref:Uncharacterized protein n=1 Tax=Trichonephila clavipes TaxID=2585209 RepID=A0A8X7BI91_TRICX|nr:hypothetical protein TNCV_753101 [Trichonephila clavipes]
MDRGVPEPIDNSRSCLAEGTVALTDGERMDLRTKGGGMKKRSRCRSRNLAPEHSRRSRECICVFRTNRTKEAEGRLLWPANDKGRGACCGPTPGVLKSFLGQRRLRREETRERREETWGQRRRMEIKKEMMRPN